jgi:hypothetical protein
MMGLAGVVAAIRHVGDRLRKLTRFEVPAAMCFSMARNALASATGATNAYELAAAVAMGVILPFLAFSIAAVLADV